MNEPLQIPITPTRLRALLSEHGLAPNRRFGQHFLVEAGILDVIERLAKLEESDVVLEVGTGVGTLTQRIAEVPHLVVTVEIDQGLYMLSRDLVGTLPNVRLVHGDIMAGKSALNPRVVEKIEAALVQPGAGELKVVANLPYAVSTPFLSALLTRFGAPARMVLMVQKELAENLSAAPGSKNYSPLTIMLSLLADVRIERTLPRDVFYPKPRVESAIAVVQGKGLDPLPILRSWPLVRHLFSERRKTVAASLKKLPPVMGGPLPPDAVPAILESVGLSGRERAEQLEPGQFLVLDRAVGRAFEGE